MLKNVMRMSALLLSALVVAGCGSSSEPSATTKAPAEKISVVTTTPVLSDFARIIGGDRVEVYDVIKPNMDPHDYEPTPADITALTTADVIVKNGLGLESWFDDTMKNADANALIVDASTGVTTRNETATTGDAVNDQSEPDPHIWHSVINAKTMVANVRNGLSSVDSANASIYQGNERAYNAQLDALRSDIARQLTVLTNKKIVTNHDALGYYIDEFGLTYVGSIIPSFDSQAELSSSQVTDIVAKIKAEQVKAIFTESSLPDRVAQTISDEAGVKIVAGEDSLYADSMGVEGSDADTYLKMERHNTSVIARNLV